MMSVGQRDGLGLVELASCERVTCSKHVSSIVYVRAAMGAQRPEAFRQRKCPMT